MGKWYSLHSCVYVAIYIKGYICKRGRKGKTDETKYVQGGIRIRVLRPTGAIWSVCFCLKSSGKIK